MNKVDLTYEEALDKLNEILEELEKNDSSLDKSIEKFKKGIKLYNYCNNLLSKAEGEVKLLLKDDFEEIAEVNFPMEDKNEFL